MKKDFASVLSGLRKERRMSQRKVAGDLGISQALLSHYENGIREPRLEFVVKVCEYYGVSADYILGRTEIKENPLASPSGAGSEEKKDASERELQHALNTAVVIIKMLAEKGEKDVLGVVAEHLGAAEYKFFSAILDGADVFDIPRTQRVILADAVLKSSELNMGGRLGRFENGEALAKEISERYPELYESVVRIIKNTESRLNELSGR